ncbi:MAG: formyltetrahydrofolate deformylase [Flavobacteriales bacterium]
MESLNADRFRVMLSCPDRKGIVAEVSGLLARQGANVTAAAQFSDPALRHFFVRYEVETAAGEASAESLERGLADGLSDLLSQPDAQLTVRRADHRPRVALLASKASHCLVEVLQRWRTGELPCDIACVVANHPHIEEFAGWFKVPFHHVPFPPGDKAASFDRVEALLKEHAVDVTVLARFMQIIPDAFAEAHVGRMINIHHSFLPSFIGARPYEQAHARGVKLVGATCHYVTPELDQGPIIDQEVVRISHRDTPADLRRKGRICEREALARGLRLHLEDRVFVHGNRTVVFD